MYFSLIPFMPSYIMFCLSEALWRLRISTFFLNMVEYIHFSWTKLLLNEKELDSSLTGFSCCLSYVELMLVGEV